MTEVDLAPKFKRSEFACKCGCGFDTVDYELLTALTRYRNYLSTLYAGMSISIVINCGCRCKNHNDALRKLHKETGGKQGEATAVNSQHIYGRAVDMKVFVDSVLLSPQAVHDHFNLYHNHFGLGNYSTFTHIDCRSIGKARW